MRKIFKKSKGVSLAEMVVAIGLFGLIISTLTVFSADAFRAIKTTQRRFEANTYLNEVYNALQVKKLDNWTNILQNTENGVKHLAYSNGTYTFEDGSVQKNGITLSLEIKNVYRDTSGNILDTNSGTLDIHTRLIDMKANWIDLMGNTKITNTKTYITDWNIPIWRQTTQTEFDNGTKQNVLTTNVSGGEITLDTIGHGDWCAPALTIGALDLPGNGIASGVTAIEGNAYTGTGGNASGLSFLDVTVANTNPPVASLGATKDGYKTNDIFGELGYFYIATDTNSKEATIFQKSGTTYNEIGYFDASGSTDANSIFVSGTTGYLAQGNIFRIFDLTSKSGSRPQLGSVTLAGTGNKIKVAGNYAYVAISGAATVKLQIIDISNPASPTIVGSANPTSQSGVDVAVNDSASRAYLVTAVSATQKELFIIDITTKTGVRPVMGSYEANGMNPKGVSIIPGNRVIIIGSGGEEYQVLGIANESNITKCGGLQVDTGINGIATVLEADNDAYAYIITGDSSQEFKIIEGGPGVGGSGQYVQTGIFTSSVFDTTSAAPIYISLRWDAQISANTLCKVQLRTADTLADVTTATWVGPNGVAGTYFTTPENTYLSTMPTNFRKRYIQYKVDFISDGGLSPQFDELEITYQK
jgi:hypothetical protein